MMYSIFGILDLCDEEKYRILTLFDEDKRIEAIKEVMRKAK